MIPVSTLIKHSITARMILVLFIIQNINIYIKTVTIPIMGGKKTLANAPSSNLDKSTVIDRIIDINIEAIIAQ